MQNDLIKRLQAELGLDRSDIILASQMVLIDPMDAYKDMMKKANVSEEFIKAVWHEFQKHIGPENAIKQAAMGAIFGLKGGQTVALRNAIRTLRQMDDLDLFICNAGRRGQFLSGDPKEVLPTIKAISNHGISELVVARKMEKHLRMMIARKRIAEGK